MASSCAADAGWTAGQNVGNFRPLRGFCLLKARASSNFTVRAHGPTRRRRMKPRDRAAEKARRSKPAGKNGFGRQEHCRDQESRPVTESRAGQAVFYAAQACSRLRKPEPKPAPKPVAATAKPPVLPSKPAASGGPRRRRRHPPPPPPRPNQRQPRRVRPRRPSRRARPIRRPGSPAPSRRRNGARQPHASSSPACARSRRSSAPTCASAAACCSRRRSINGMPRRSAPRPATSPSPTPPGRSSRSSDAGRRRRSGATGRAGRARRYCAAMCLNRVTPRTRSTARTN